MKRTSSNDLSRRAAACPGCERYIGPVAKCPYCGADAGLPVSFRALRIAALALAGVGLLFLYLMARHSDLPLTDISEITPLMNYATVRVGGTVKLRPYISQRNGCVDYVSFLVDDGTGAMRVSADGGIARALMKEKLIPRRGQNVDVTGRVSARANRAPRLYMQTARGMAISQLNSGG